MHMSIGSKFYHITFHFLNKNSNLWTSILSNMDHAIRKCLWAYADSKGPDLRSPPVELLDTTECMNGKQRRW